MGAFAVISPFSMSMVSSNVVGNTKTTTVGTMLFVTYCVGNIISPQIFLTSQEPTYPTGIKVSLAGLSLGFVSALALRFYLQWRNSETGKAVNADDTLQSDESQESNEDKTDRELKGFIYIL